MPRAASSTLDAAVAGLELVYALVQTVDGAFLEQALRERVPAPRMGRVPSWEELEAFVAANPEFLNSNARDRWWGARSDVQSRVNLMLAMERDLRRGHGTCIYLFPAEVRRDAKLASRIPAAAEDIDRVFGEAGLSREEKRQRIRERLR